MVKRLLVDSFPKDSSNIHKTCCLRDLALLISANGIIWATSRRDPPSALWPVTTKVLDSQQRQWEVVCQWPLLEVVWGKRICVVVTSIMFEDPEAELSFDARRAGDSGEQEWEEQEQVEGVESGQLQVIVEDWFKVGRFSRAACIVWSIPLLIPSICWSALLVEGTGIPSSP